MNLSKARLPENRDLWLVRIFFFIFIGGGGFLLPFASLFFDRQGLTGAQIGLLGTVMAVAQIIAAPFWGRLSDRTARPRRVLQVALIGSALMMMALSQQTRFIWMAVIVCGDALISGGSMPLADALALGVTGESNYGSIRLWGSLGWAGIVLLSGWLIEQTGLFAAFAGYAISYVVSALFLLLIAPGTARRGQTQQDHAPGSGLASLRDGLLHNRAIVWMAVSLVAAILFRTGLFRFEPIYLDQLGAPESIIGLGSTIGALVEMPGMLWADRLNKRIGPRRLMMAANGIRVGMMAAVLLVPTVTTIVLTKVAGGFSFSFYAVALVMFVREAVPDDQRATGLALFTITLPALTNIVGNPLSGVLFDRLGAYWLYAFALGGFALSWLILRLAVPRMRDT